MKLSFNQTYSNDRKILLEARLRDKKFIEFLSFFDINIFSFHNCNDNILDFFKNIKNKIPNVKIHINNNISYTQCIRRLLRIVETLNVKHFFFYQDDTFSCDNNISFDGLLNYVFKQNDIMLTLYERKEFFEDGTVLLESFDDLDLYSNNTENFVKHNRWSFDDSPYICTTNYLSQIYDENYLNHSDVWSAECYNNFKFKTSPINRYITNKSLFKNYNFIGRNNWNKDEEIKTLKEKNILP
jgi:hypothetical protein